MLYKFDNFSTGHTTHSLFYIKSDFKNVQSVTLNISDHAATGDSVFPVSDVNVVHVAVSFPRSPQSEISHIVQYLY